MFTLSIYEILLSKVRSVLWPTQQSTGSKSLKVSAKKQKYIANLFHLLEKWLIYKIRRFWIIFKFFWVLFKPFSTAKIEKLDYWDANNYTNFKHKQLEKHKYKVYQPNTIKKLVECPLRNVAAKAIFSLTVFEILLSKGTSVLWPAQWSTARERIQVSVKSRKNVVNLLELLEKWLTYKLMRFWIVFKFFLISFNPFNTEKI